MPMTSADAIDNLPDLDLTADRLHTVAIHLLRRVRVEDEASGLSPARLSALSVVIFGGPLRLGELAAAEQVQPPTMSALVTALEESGLVERQADPEDGRSILVAATDHGRDILELARTRRLRRLRNELANLPEEQLHSVTTAVDILYQLFLS